MRHDAVETEPSREIALLDNRWSVTRNDYDHTDRVFYQVEDKEVGIYTPNFNFDVATDDKPDHFRGNLYGVVPVDVFLDHAQEWLVQEETRSGVEVYILGKGDEDGIIISGCVVQPDGLKQSVQEMTSGKDEPDSIRVFTDTGFWIDRSIVLNATRFNFSPSSSGDQGPFRALLSGVKDSVQPQMPTNVFQRSINVALADSTQG